MNASRPAKLFIVGATGKTGACLVEQALSRGHQVTAFVRNPSRIQARSEQLTVVTGDVFDATQLTEAARGHDAALCSIGAPGRNRDEVRTRATRALVAALPKAGVERLIVQTSYGASESRANLPFVFRRIILPLLLGPAFKDHDAQETLIRASSLRWTLVRPPGLTDGPLTGSYRRDFAPHAKGLKWQISRADVAHLMLDLLEEEEAVGRAVPVSSERA